MKKDLHCAHSKKKEIFILTSYNLCIATMNIKLKVIIFMIRNYQLDETITEWIQHPKPHVVFEVPTIGPQTNPIRSTFKS